MTRKLTICTVGCAFASCVLAEVTTNVIDIAELAACTNLDATVVCYTNGWECLGIDSYKDQTSVNPVNIRISENADYIVSTNFNSVILAIVVKVHSSSSTGRRLAFEPWIGSAFSADSAAKCDYTPNKDTYVFETIEFPEGVEATKFRMKLDGGGGSTGWGVSYMAVVTEENPLAAPEDLSVVKTNSHSCALAWTNSAWTASNKVTTIRHDLAGFGEIPDARWDFSFLPDAGGNPVLVTDDVLAEMPDLYGENLYVPARTNGILQLGTGSNLGILVLPPMELYTDRVLRLAARRYSSDEASMPIEYVSGGVTNLLASVRLPTEDFDFIDVPLGEVPTGARIIINRSSAPSNKRVWLTSAEIVCTNAPIYSQFTVGANFVECSSTGSGPFGMTKKIGPLKPQSRYSFEVLSYGTGGVVAGPSSTPVVVTAREQGMRVSLR